MKVFRGRLAEEEGFEKGGFDAKMTSISRTFKVFARARALWAGFLGAGFPPTNREGFLLSLKQPGRFLKAGRLSMTIRVLYMYVLLAT